MGPIGNNAGNLLNHIEALYRPGERDLAIQLVEALGCSISDTGFLGDGPETFLAVHPNPADADGRNNVFYMSPMRPEQQALEARLAQLLLQDSVLAASMERYRHAACTLPFGVSHFGLRYSDESAIRAAIDNVRRVMSGTPGDRVHTRIFHPDAGERAGSTVVQGFVFQDVIVSGSFAFGQIIELQSISL